MADLPQPTSPPVSVGPTGDTPNHDATNEDWTAALVLVCLVPVAFIVSAVSSVIMDRLRRRGAAVSASASVIANTAATATAGSTSPPTGQRAGDLEMGTVSGPGSGSGRPWFPWRDAVAQSERVLHPDAFPAAGGYGRRPSSVVANVNFAAAPAGKERHQQHRRGETRWPQVPRQGHGGNHRARKSTGRSIGRMRLEKEKESMELSNRGSVGSRMGGGEEEEAREARQKQIRDSFRLDSDAMREDET